jgi:2-polyprenyl-6-methoxyphenol hydroxylase-like FAD-dependent oxidoreductase
VSGAEAERIVIVGGGPAGQAAAGSYREGGGTGTVTILAREGDAPYERGRELIEERAAWS